MPKMIAATIRQRLRPKRSPSGPKVRAPIMAPRSAAEKIGPSAVLARLSFSAISGAATAIDWLSSPSRNATREQRMIAPI